MNEDTIKLQNFILEEFDDSKKDHWQLKRELIQNEDSYLISRDIDNFIKRNNVLHQQDNITNTFSIIYDGIYIGIAFLNYHPEEIREGIVLEEEIEIGLGLLPVFRDKHLGSLFEREFCEYLLEKYPQFNEVVARIENDNTRSIKAANYAGFEHINGDEYHFKRKI